MPSASRARSSPTWWSPTSRCPGKTVLPSPRSSAPWRRPKRSPSSSSPGPWSPSTRRASRPAGREASFSSPSSPGSCWRTSNGSCARVTPAPESRKPQEAPAVDERWDFSDVMDEVEAETGKSAAPASAAREVAAPRGDPPRGGQDPSRLQRVRCVDRRDRRGRARFLRGAAPAAPPPKVEHMESDLPADSPSPVTDLSPAVDEVEEIEEIEHLEEVEVPCRRPTPSPPRRPLRSGSSGRDGADRSPGTVPGRPPPGTRRRGTRRRKPCRNPPSGVRPADRRVHRRIARTPGPGRATRNCGNSSPAAPRRSSGPSPPRRWKR